MRSSCTPSTFEAFSIYLKKIKLVEWTTHARSNQFSVLYSDSQLKNSSIMFVCLHNRDKSDVPVITVNALWGPGIPIRCVTIAVLVRVLATLDVCVLWPSDKFFAYGTYRSCHQAGISDRPAESMVNQ